MNKSIAIIGKGPSTKRCRREFVESFDEVAICGRPVFDGYEEFIGERAHWDFLNNSATKYSNELVEKLGIVGHISTANPEVPALKDFCPEFYDAFQPGGPSTGTAALDWFLRYGGYDKIALIGFDLFPVGEYLYYYKKEEWNPNTKYLLEPQFDEFDSEGLRLKPSGHKTELTFEYMNSMFDKHKDKTFYLITDYPFKERDNVKLKYRSTEDEN